MEIIKLFEFIVNNENCLVYPPSGFPKTRSDLNLPQDLVWFYSRCGGVSLFNKSPFDIEIVSPDNFLLTNDLKYGNNWKVEYSSSLSSRSEFFYDVAHGSSYDFSIDLNPRTNGYIFDSYGSNAGTEESSLVAKTFSEMIRKVIESNGMCPVKLKCDSNIKDLGDIISYEKRPKH